MRRRWNWFNSQASPGPAEPAGAHGHNSSSCYNTSASDSPSSLNHSSRSPTPISQPPTPLSPASDRSSPAKPITIPTPHRNTFATAFGPARIAVAVPDDDDGDDEEDEDFVRFANAGRAFTRSAVLDSNADMTTGPNFDSAPGRSRQDSFVSAGAKPISMANPNREHVNRGRRESVAGSMMGGMSWGGISVGSFIREE